MIFLLLFSQLSFAIQLSPESLFRHASNGDVESNTVSVNFLVKKISSEEGHPLYLRHIYGIEGEKIRFSQLIFNGQDMSNNQLQDVFTTSNLMDYLGKNSEKDTLNATVINILFNQSWPIISYLKKIGIPLKSNSELYNKDKTKLLDAYKTFLKNPTTKENPLKPTTYDERKRINELNDSSLFVVNPENVKLVRKNRTNLIQLNYPNFIAHFTNSEHRLVEIEITGKHHIHMLLEEYIAINGLNNFPKFITINVDNEVYRLQTLSYKYANENYVEFDKRSNNLILVAKKNAKDVLAQKPIFLQ